MESLETFEVKRGSMAEADVVLDCRKLAACGAVCAGAGIQTRDFESILELWVGFALPALSYKNNDKISIF